MIRNPLPVVHQQIDLVGPDGRVRPDVRHDSVDQLRAEGFKIIRGWKELYLPQYDQSLNPSGQLEESMIENIEENDVLECELI